MNRVGKSPVLVNSSVGGNVVATTSRDSEGGDSDRCDDGRSPTPPHSMSPSVPPPGGHSPRPAYDDEFTLNAINNATLPYFRNSQHKGSPDTNSISNTNFPKSASSWGPLHKPVHWKVRVWCLVSYSFILLNYTNINLPLKIIAIISLKKHLTTYFITRATKFHT